MHGAVGDTFADFQIFAPTSDAAPLSCESEPRAYAAAHAAE